MANQKKETDKNLDEAYCQSIGKSIAEILRYSLDEEFRKRAFNALQVSSSQETEIEISNKLMSMIQNKTKTKRKSKKVVDMENPVELPQAAEEESDFSQSKTTNSSTSTTAECSVEAVIPSFSKRNWLQISSEKYNESLKRRKLGYHSQPLFNHTQVTHEEIKDCRISSEFSCNSLSQENSSSEVFDNNEEYYKNKFKDLFKDDGNKYLRRNLKSKKYLSL